MGEPGAFVLHSLVCEQKSCLCRELMCPCLCRISCSIPDILVTFMIAIDGVWEMLPLGCCNVVEQTQGISESSLAKLL